MINCKTCNYSCEEYSQLAHHVIKNRETHHKSFKWASSFLLKVNILNQKKDFEGRMPVDDNLREAKLQCIREVSGEAEIVLTICPTCSNVTTIRVEKEFAENKLAWRSKAGVLMVSCDRCRRNN